jgi:hypothetical protein
MSRRCSGSVDPVLEAAKGWSFIQWLVVDAVGILTDGRPRTSNIENPTSNEGRGESNKRKQR